MHLLAPLRLARPDELKRRGAGFLDRDCFPAAFFLDRLCRRLEPPLPDGAAAVAKRAL